MTTPREDAIAALDEQRLAVAMHESYDRNPEVPMRHWGDIGEHEKRMWVNHAKTVAAKYAALAAADDRPETRDPHQTPEPITYEQAVNHWLDSPEAAEALQAVIDARCRCGKVSVDDILAALREQGR